VGGGKGRGVTVRVNFQKEDGGKRLEEGGERKRRG